MINNKYYENLTIKKSLYYNDLIRALNIVEKFVKREELMLVGGIAIDLALKAKQQKGIYTDEVLPDYDVFSNNHFQDAYKVAEWLARSGFKDISVINALHPSTVKVRIKMIAIMDITYIPENILKNIPYIWHKGFKIVHPHYQFISQHRSVFLPFENPPSETILFRLKKDLERYDLLYEQYPLRKLNLESETIDICPETYVYMNQIQNTCITGFVALNYWINIAKKYGYSPVNNFGNMAIHNNNISYSIPKKTILSLYTDDIKNTYNAFTADVEEYYNRVLDYLPKKVVLDNKIEIFENNHKISAHKVREDLYIVNIVGIMLYLIVNYILIMKIENIPRNYAFYAAYLECRNLVDWASKNCHKYEELYNLLPSGEVYGKYNMSDSFITSKYNFDVKNQTITENINKFRQPKHVYDRDLEKMNIPKSYWDFDVTRSEVYNLDYKKIEPFI